MADFNYKTTGSHVTLMHPKGDLAINMFDKISTTYPGAKIPTSVWPSIRNKIRKEGFSVTKYKCCEFTKEEKAKLMTNMKKELENFYENI